LVGYNAEKEALAKLGAQVVIAGSVDSEEDTKPVAAEVDFPVAHGVTQAQGEAMGAWWDDGRKIIQPAEFILRQDGSVVSSTYSSGPIGRVEPADALKMINHYETRG